MGGGTRTLSQTASKPLIRRFLRPERSFVGALRVLLTDLQGRSHGEECDEELEICPGRIGALSLTPLTAKTAANSLET